MQQEEDDGTAPMESYVRAQNGMPEPKMVNLALDHEGPFLDEGSHELLKLKMRWRSIRQATYRGTLKEVMKRSSRSGQ